MPKTTYNIKHFTPGKEVWYNGQYFIVKHVLLRDMDVYVYLDGLQDPVLSSMVWCEPTAFLLKRKDYRGDSGHR